MRYLHTMLRVTDLEASLRFFALLDFHETYRQDFPKGRFTLVFLGAKQDIEKIRATNAPCVELTYNWDVKEYSSSRNFGHLAYEVDNIYSICAHLVDNNVAINRPPRDGQMAFVKSPDGISIELLQKGTSLAPMEPWASALNIGEW